MRRHDDRALDLYLLHHAIASADPWNVARPSRVWARAMDLGASDAAREAISKTWRRLETLGLVHRAKIGRLADVTLLCEDGSGEPYGHPGAEATQDMYFTLPFVYWTADEQWRRRLDLAAKAALLIALSLEDDFVLPYEKAATWYGISAETAEKGLRRLRREGLLAQRHDYKEAPLSEHGFTQQNYYELAPPFGPRGRRSQRAPRKAA